MKHQSTVIYFILLITTFLVTENIWSANLTKNGDSNYIKYNKTILLRDFDGKDHKLQECTGTGKWLVVMIWSSDCHVCNTEVEKYVAFHQQHKNRDATVLGISTDGWEFKDNAVAFINKHKVSFPNLISSPIVVAHFVSLLFYLNIHIPTPESL